MVMPSKPPIILVVDDDPGVVATATLQLQPIAAEVLGCYSGEAALDMMTARPDIDLVLADIRMPGMSGIELAQRIRAQHPRVPVVLTSAYVEAPTGLPFVPKPWRQDALRAVIRHHLGG